MSKALVGSRLEVEGFKGTIKYEGPVEGTKGTWLGVDWDDPSRGKHNGCHNGKIYFEARGDSSASFIKESKANFGKSFIRAVHDRYRTRLAPDVAAQMHVRGTTDQITAVQLVGNEQISDRQSQIDKLEEVHVSDMRVRGFDQDEGEEELLDMYPKNAVALGLGGNLLPSWSEVAKITSKMPRLESLYLDENLLSPLTNLSDLAGAFNALKVITLTKMGLDWPTIAYCFPSWPVLEKLILANNKITTTSVSLPSSLPPLLRLLNLDSNPLCNWCNVLEFSSHPCLTSLSLADCKLTDLHLEGNVRVTAKRMDGHNGHILGGNSNSNDSTGDLAKLNHNNGQLLLSSDAFPVLEHLNLRNNNVTSWQTIALLSKISKLNDFVIAKNPVLNLENPETSRQIILVKMMGLTRLNHDYVNPKERRGAEIDYIKKYSADYLDAKKSCAIEAFSLEHPTFKKLIEVWGEPEVPVVTNMQFEKQLNLKKSLILIEIWCEGKPELKLKKSVPGSMTLQKVKTMASRGLKGVGNIRTLQIKVVSSDRSFVIDNDMKEVSFYGITNGDSLVLCQPNTNS